MVAEKFNVIGLTIITSTDLSEEGFRILLLYTSLQSQKAVASYLKSKLLLHFSFAKK